MSAHHTNRPAAMLQYVLSKPASSTRRPVHVSRADVLSFALGLSYRTLGVPSPCRHSDTACTRRKLSELYTKGCCQFAASADMPGALL